MPNTGANDATVRLAGESAATDPVVHICARCGGVLRHKAGAAEPHGELACIDELRRALFAAHRRIAELEGREEV